jgi:predicted enzyme related to lactoylglutathione lyase
MNEHPVVWFEVIGDDGAKLRDFYGQLFGWKYDVVEEMQYGMVDSEGERGICGGVGQGEAKRVTFYVSTDDIERSLAEATKLGGKTLMERTQLPGGTVLGMFADPQGNAIGLVEEGA